MTDCIKNILTSKLSVITDFYGEYFLYQKSSAQTIREVHLQIGRNIKKCRKSKGLSQLDLSIELGYKSTSTIAMAEVNYKDAHFNIENLVNISRCLEIDFDELLVGISDIAKK